MGISAAKSILWASDGLNSRENTFFFLFRHHDKVESRAFFEGVEIFHGFVERQRGSVEHEIAEVGLTVCFKPCKSLIGPALEGPLLSGDVRYRYFGIGIGEQTVEGVNGQDVFLVDMETNKILESCRAAMSCPIQEWQAPRIGICRALRL